MLSGRGRIVQNRLGDKKPLVIAIHGGTYTSAYFDVPGFSLLDRARALDISLLALDRPGYGESPAITDAKATIKTQAEFLVSQLHDAWKLHGEGHAGIVLIGHSIGAAIACRIASAASDLPLIGLAISGVCLRTPPEHKPMWEALPDIPFVEIPSEQKDVVMFGPEGSFDPTAPARSRIASTTAPRAELVDIVSTWNDDVHDILANIRVPVHLRQAEQDNLWIVSEDEVSGFGRALTNAPRVDVAMMRNTGHCMDFHTVGAALQVQQLGFALQCSAERD